MNEREIQITKPSEIKSGEIKIGGNEAGINSEFERASLEEKPNRTLPAQIEENQFPRKLYRRIPGIW